MSVVRATALAAGIAVVMLGLGAARIAAGSAPETAARMTGAAASRAGAGVCAVVAGSVGAARVRVILPAMHSKVEAPAAVSCSVPGAGSGVATPSLEALAKSDRAG